MSASGLSGPSSGPVRVLRIDQAAVTVVLFLGPLEGHLEHWTGKRSVPCLGEEECEKAVHRLRTVFYAYTPVGHFNPSTGNCEPAVFQLTASAEEDLRGRQLRGQIWSWSRDERRGKVGRVSGTFLEQRNPDQCPPAFPILSPLLRLFGVTRLKLGVRNPNPAPLVIESFDVEPFRLSRIETEEAKPSRPSPAEVEAIREKLRKAAFPNGRK